jgi:hypothetical protein
MPDDKDKGKPWLATLFWIAACGNVLLVLIPALREANHPGGEFSGLFVIMMFAIVVCLAVVIVIVAVIRKPWRMERAWHWCPCLRFGMSH